MIHVYPVGEPLNCGDAVRLGAEDGCLYKAEGGMSWIGHVRENASPGAPVCVYAGLPGPVQAYRTQDYYKRKTLSMAKNSISTICRPRYCTEIEFQRIARTCSDTYLLQLRNIGKKALAVFREAYGPAASPPGPVERPEDV